MAEAELQIPGVVDLEAVRVGGDAIVYRARQPTIDRWVAVKILNESDEATRRRFDREQKAMGRLSRHPGVVTVYETGYLEDGRPYLVMPWIDAGSLQDRIDTDGPWPLPEAVEAIGRVAETLQFAHDSGIVHADIKPGNLLIDNDGQLLVADFGIASISDFAHTRTSSTAFTPRYSAPELIAGDRPTPATDLYSLAATLYTMVNGRPPFGTGGDLVALADEIATTSAPPLGDEVPQQVEAAYQRAMSKAPADRHKNVREFAAALRQEAIPVDKSPPAERLGRKWLWVAAAAIVLILALSAGALLPSSSGLDQPDRTALDSQATATTPTTSATTTALSTTTTVPLPTTSMAPALTEPPAPTTTEPPALVELFADAEIQEIPVGGTPKTPVLYEGFVWLVRDDEGGDSTLLRLDAASGAVVDTVSFEGIVRGPAGVDGIAWVHNVTEGTLVGVDAAAGGIVDTIRISAGRSYAPWWQSQVYDILGGQELSAPVTAADGTIWVSLNGPAEVVRVDPENSTAASIPLFLDTVSSPVPGTGSVWIKGETVCFDGRSVELPGSSWELVGLEDRSPEVCTAVQRFDLETGTMEEPLPVGLLEEWIDPASTIEAPRCSVDDPSDCITGTTSAANFYDAFFPPDFLGRRPGDASGTSAILWDGEFWSGDAWLQGAVGFAKTGEHVGAFVCPRSDGVGVRIAVAGRAMWIVEFGGWLCAADGLERNPSTGEVCQLLGGRDACREAEWINPKGPVFEAPASFKLDEVEAPPFQPVPALYGSSIWLTLPDGALLMLDFDGDTEITIAASFTFSDGIGLPLVTPDGSVWVPSAGRVSRIVPAVTPGEFSG